MSRTRIPEYAPCLGNTLSASKLASTKRAKNYKNRLSLCRSANEAGQIAVQALDLIQEGIMPRSRHGTHRQGLVGAVVQKTWNA